MTDSEKELRRLAESVTTGKTVYMFYDEYKTAATVLTLLERIEALEKQVIEAERKGAEEMRDSAIIALAKKAAECCANEEACITRWKDHESAADWAGQKQAVADCIDLVKGLPLPGDAP